MKGNSMNQDNKAEWYVVHTYSGYENKVKVDIEKTVENRDLGDEILEVIVPTEQVTEHKEDGTKKTMSRKMFPGYVLVKMIQNDDTWYVVRNTRGVTGFVGPGSKPVPLTDEEMNNLGISIGKVAAEYSLGDTVMAISGVWENTVGEIKSINDNKQTVTITVDMFGRETPVELGFTEIRHI